MVMFAHEECAEPIQEKRVLCEEMSSRMSRFLNGKSIAIILVALTLVAGAIGGIALRGNTHAAAPKTAVSRAAAGSSLPLCSKLGKTMQASAGAQMICFGPQANGPAAAVHPSTRLFGSNVNAANPQEDISPNGTQAYGQSEVSTAAISTYVVEAWNDATGFFSAPCSPMYKDQLTGFGFSNNGGKSFTDLGGLPNAGCATSAYSGDASVETWTTGGHTYFYISSLFFDGNIPAEEIAMDVCVVNGSGSSATLSCNATPVIIANPGVNGFDDKDFLSIDPKHGLLYASYTDFSTGDNIDLVACDIGNGALGGTAAAPVCAAPIVVASSTSCNELEGAYPAADVKTGDVYVAYENNWATNFGCNLPVQENVNKVPASCVAVALGLSGTCAYATNTFPLAAVNIVSMDAAFIPGYNRFPMNDFPRIAVSDPFKTVSIVWNDARFHPAGDILLQSFWTGSFPAAVQSSPTRINSATGGWHMLPALRNTDDDGDLQISFYGRAKANTDVTSVYAAIDVSPKTRVTPGNALVTTVASAWNSVSSDIVPNFGDYTDNYVIATASAPYTEQTLYVAWSDGRLGDPQPFNAHTQTN